MSLRATSISEIKANLLRPSTTSSFLAFIPFPDNPRVNAKMKQLVGSSQNKLILSCSECSLPGNQLATSVNDNDRTGVTERHAYRKIFNDRVDLTFYVDAEEYLTIKFFELWMSYIAGEDLQSVDIASNNFSYRFRYPDEYISDQGMSILKFEKDIITKIKKSNPLEDIVNVIAGTDFGTTQDKRTGSSIQYQFLRTFPVAINSMPLSYETSQLLKVTVSMSYTRYILNNIRINNVGASPSEIIANQRGFERTLDILTNSGGGESFGLSGAGTIRDLDSINRGTSGVPITPPGFGGIA